MDEKYSAITTKQRAYLRGLANAMEPILHIGKQGITENLIQQAQEALAARELIKGTVQENAPIDAREAIAELCRLCCAEPVQVIGRRFVMYKKSHDHPKIELPR